MPSDSDLTDTADDLTIVAPAVTDVVAPDDVLAGVKAEGLRRRTRRHRRNTVLAAVALAVVAVPAVALLPGDDGGEDITVAADPGDASATTVDRTPSTTPSTVATVAPTTVVVESEDPAVIAPPTSAQQAPATTVPAAPACRNSTDPACGEFRWDPAPAPNQPLTASFVDAPATAAVGEEVVFAVAWSDPDATLDFEHFSADGVMLAQPCTHTPRYGSWTPPDPVGGSGELSYTHTFDAPGTYRVGVGLATGPCDSPYNSQTLVETTITVE